MRRRTLALLAPLALAALLAPLALAGCDLGLGSDPWGGLEDDPCLPGHWRTGGQACVLPEASLSIDGDAQDWAAFAVLPLTTACVGPDCALAAPAELQLAYSAAEPRQLFLRVRLAGGAAPATDARVWYGLRFTATEAWPSPETDLMLGGAGGLHFLKSGWFVEPPPGQPTPYAFALTPDGFEASVPIAYLPFVGGAQVTPMVWVDAAGALAPTLEAAPVLACWWAEDFMRDACRGLP